MIDFLLKSTLSLGLLYAVYIVLLEREKMHQFNRFYLLFSLIFALIIPFIAFEIYVESVVVANEVSIQAMPYSTVLIAEKTNYVSILLWSIYAIVTFILALRFVTNLIKIQKKINSNESKKIENATLILLNEQVLPHTFLNSIFINKEEYENRKIEAELFSHELTHVRQKHTLDILIIEILKTIFWFNPLFIFYKKAIQLNHEFLADENVVQSYNNVPFYQNLLLEKASSNSNFYLASNLNYLVTKKRLIMMTKTTSTKMLLFRKLALIPILSGMIYLFCFETVAQNKIQAPKVETQNSKVSNDKELNDYFAGVRFKVYKNGYSTRKQVIGEDLIIDKLYEELTPEEKLRFKVFLKVPKATVKKSPTLKEMEDFKNGKKYAIWIDGKNVPNTELNKYKPSDIASFSGSVILKNARTKKHPQPFQYWFYTHPYFDKNEMGKKQTKYGGDKIEIFERLNNKEVTQKKSEKSIEPEINVEVKKANVDTENPVYTATEKKPDFPGGIKAFYEFVGQNFKAPEAKVNGRVYIKFIVEADGSLSNFEIMRDIGYGTGEEAVRVLKLSPKWIPGEQDGTPVRVQYSLPISISGS